ncbi:FmdB family zinc ribbon protein, partial [Kitasatospora sp. NPDC091257]|uniref:FmdB family zinc ribbon protein n=1 Tax=Kitasatospora sp. NPDC091257 TaxID=3364084 RepID=UPI00380B1EE1
MPRYDFRCRSCGATFELRRPMAQANDPGTSTRRPARRSVSGCSWCALLALLGRLGTRGV